MFTEFSNYLHNRFWNILFFSKRNLYPLAVIPIPLHPPGPGQLLIHFLSLQICLFQKFHIIELYNVLFWDWLFNLMFSRVMNVVARISSSFLLLPSIILLYRYITFYLFVHQLVNLDLSVGQRCILSVIKSKPIFKVVLQLYRK